MGGLSKNKHGNSFLCKQKKFGELLPQTSYDLLDLMRFDLM